MLSFTIGGAFDMSFISCAFAAMPCTASASPMTVDSAAVAKSRLFMASLLVSAASTRDRPTILRRARQKGYIDTHESGRVPHRRSAQAMRASDRYQETLARGEDRREKRGATKLPDNDHQSSILG